jgi:HD superfamily phosphohydrolase
MSNSKAQIGPHGKVFRDAVHGLIRIEPDDSFLLDLINTPEFQRLRRVRQLGVSSMTYPGAEHSRFAHSLGVLCLAQRILGTLRHRYRKDSAATDLLDEHDKIVKAAALLHDVGHAPFSHMMERAFPATAKHEKRTEELVTDSTSSIRSVLAGHGLDPEKVRDIIKKVSEHRLLVDIVSSQLDADRMDYILRDALATGVKYGAFDLDWLVNSLCIGTEPKQNAPGGQTEWRLCLEQKRGLHSAEQLIIARMHMSLQVYFHKATRGWEAHLLCLFNHAAALAKSGKLPERTPEIAQNFFAAEGKLTQSDFLMCDEATLLSAMQAWCLSPKNEHKRLAELSGCFLRRQKAFLCHDLGGAKVGQVVKLSEALNRVGQKNLDWVLDDLDFNSYRDFDSVFRAGSADKEGQEEAASTEAILLAEGSLGSPSRAAEGPSVVLRALGANSQHSIYRLYYHHRISETVKKLLGQIKLNYA